MTREPLWPVSSFAMEFEVGLLSKKWQVTSRLE
jgi:hypothetical protein